MISLAHTTIITHNNKNARSITRRHSCSRHTIPSWCVSSQISLKGALSRALWETSHVVLANIWRDLTETDIEDARLDEKDRNEKGFKMFMIAYY
eukprot:scaffold2078_cov41-Attheya_sp.AAC.1